MHIGLLGELEVLDDDERGRRRRGQAAGAARVLALHAGRVVPPTSSSTRCGARIRRPRCATAFRGWRRSFAARSGSADLVAMRGGGYVARAPRGAVDVHRFEQLVAQDGRAAATATRSRAVALLAEADSLWRGERARRVRLRGVRRRRRSPACRSCASRRSRSDSTSSCSSGDTRARSAQLEAARRRPSVA